MTDTLAERIEAASGPDYDAIYRKLHPRMFPYSPWERQRELRDLWPVEQAKFRAAVKAIRAHGGEG